MERSKDTREHSILSSYLLAKKHVGALFLPHLASSMNYPLFLNRAIIILRLH